MVMAIDGFKLKDRFHTLHKKSSKTLVIKVCIVTQSIILSKIQEKSGISLIQNC